MKSLRTFSANRRGLTLMEVLTAIVLVAVTTVVIYYIRKTAPTHVYMSGQLSNGKNIFTSMVNYAGTEDYPLYRDRKDPVTRITASSEAFEILLEGGYVDDKRIFFANNSAWCRKVDNTPATAKQVLPGENDWCYVAGLNRSTAKNSWPILANAFVPGTTYYVADPAQKGGAWKGTRAIVIYCGGNAEIVDTLHKGGYYIVPRTDQPKEDAFVSSGDWLSGPYIKVLYPVGG